MIKHPHPVDELADIRAQRRILAAREDAIRRRLLASGNSTNLVGDKFLATVSEFEHGELDRNALEQRFGKAQVAACVNIVRHQLISLTRRRRGQKQERASLSAVDMTAT
jgi:hypothetical protein